MAEITALIAAVVVVVLMFIFVVKTVRIVPQARARNIERFGRYRQTLEPGMNFIIPFVDRVKPLIDLREQVVSFKGQPVITEDNLVVLIDTVLFFQVTDPRAADYEIVDYIQAIEQITATMLRSVIGNMDLEQTLTSRDKINTMLRGVLDDASGKWGLRVTRVEIKAIDPPKSVIDAMEKQMRAEREKRAAILTAEGLRQSKILTAEGEKQSQILRAEGDKLGQILRAEGQSQAIGTVFQAVHRNDADSKVLAYQYLQTLPQLAQAEGNTFWVIPSEVTTALKTLSSAFGGDTASPPAAPQARPAGGGGARSRTGSQPGRSRRSRRRRPARGKRSHRWSRKLRQSNGRWPRRRGPAPASARDAGACLGSETDREAKAADANVRRLRPGDQVLGFCRGAFAEYACAAADMVVPKPASLTFEQAAAVPIAATTALRGIRDVGEVKAGQRVLVNGADGGVGTYAVQIAAALGAEVTGVCSTRNAGLVRSIGAAHVVNYTAEDFTDGRTRYDVILDNVSSPPLSRLRGALTPHGTLVLNGGGSPGHVFGPVAGILRAVVPTRSSRSGCARCRPGRTGRSCSP